jgi:two-component system response regulator
VQQGDVLLVEDNPDDVAFARRAFRQFQMEDLLTVARDGDEALRYLFDDEDGAGGPRPKVILLDLKLPGLDGRAVLQRIRADDRTRLIPVVIVSTSSRPADIESCYRLGANSYIAKQYTGSNPGQYLVEVARYWLTLNRVTAGHGE